MDRYIDTIEVILRIYVRFPFFTQNTAFIFHNTDLANRGHISVCGLYVDGEVGAVGSTGRGEANLYNLTCFLICENLRRGMSPKDAGMDGLRRVQANTVEKRLLNSRGLPNFGLSFYVLDRSGRHAGVSMYARLTSRYAVCTEKGASLMPLEPLLEGSADD